MTEKDPQIILSPKSCRVIEGDITIEVRIFRLADSNEWTLEVVDENDASLVWNDAFPSDEAAWQAFEDDVRELGLAKLTAVEQSETVH